VAQLRDELQRLLERDASADVHAAAVEREAVLQRGTSDSLSSFVMMA
jgi:hypothetical protein